jgi:beta-glucanase (GH16 family)
MNLFWKKLFGTLVPTGKLEKNEAELIEAMERYDKIAKSPQLVEYNKLFHIVKSAAFQENRNTLKNRKYKDTEEYQNSHKYQKLHESSDIKLYFEVLASAELAQYLAFEASPAFEDLGDKKRVAASEILRKFYTFKHSKAYKTYVRFHESYIIKEYEKLKAKISTPEFVKANEFWANQNRWNTTPEYQTEQQFYKLVENEDIKFYVNEKPERFKHFRNVKLSFSDEFDAKTISEKQWNFGFHYKNPKLIKQHSFYNEKQANSGGKNTRLVNSHLEIETKEEKSTAIAWHHKQGFLNKDFKFTSDIVQTAEKFNQKFGIFRAKIRCIGSIHHAFWLGSGEKLPLINIFHYNGKSITMGNVNKDKVDGIKVNGLNPSEFYIYSLLWTEKELVWMVNNLEVYRTSNNIPKSELYLAFNSFISEKQKGGVGSMEVDWVRVYTV